MKSWYRQRLYLPLFLFFSLLASMGVLGQPEAAAATRYVNAAAAGANDGTSWADAYTDLKAALTAAVSGDQIWVAAGTYKPGGTGIDPRAFAFELKDGVAIYGGFPATGTPVWEDRDWQTYVTTLSGDIDGNDTLDDGNAYNVVRASGGPYDPLTQTAILDGFTITGGNAAAGYSNGGGVMVNYAAPTLKHLIISANNAAYGGGGIYVGNSGNPVIENVSVGNNAAAYGGGMYIGYGASALMSQVTFSTNTATTRGGGLYNYGSPTLTNVSFDHNAANGTAYTSGDGGGGMYTAGDPTLNGGTFSNNTAESGGAGLYFYSGTISLNNVTFQNNTANGTYGYGGGMYIRYVSGTPSLTNVTFSGNGAQRGGGLYNHYGGSVTVTNAKFLNNTATESGGGIDMEGASTGLITITNAVFAGNAAGGPTTVGVGGGYSGQSGIATITNCLFTGNYSKNIGGGIGNFGGAATVRNSILWGNSASTGPQINNGTVTYSDVQGGFGGTGNIALDPSFVNAAGGDYHLLSGSSCINTGSDDLVPTGITTDLDGNPRFAGTVDMGPYEFQPTPKPATHFTVSAPAAATAGSEFSFTVTALDAEGNTAIGYTGTVHFTSSDTNAVLPADGTLTNGVGTFSATLKTAGNQTVTATDTTDDSITGTSSPIDVSPGPATHLSVSAPTSATAGLAFSVTVTAFDASNNTATGYTGTVRFSSSDSQATLPVNTALTNGTGTFSATLRTAGNQTITATDTTNTAITGTSNDIAVASVGTSPDLAITKKHAGDFVQEQTGASYTIKVFNVGNAPTAGTVTVTDDLPTGMTATAMSGKGWSCTLGTLTCTRREPLAPGLIYPVITLKVDVASDAPANVVNTATVSVDGDANITNNTSADPTAIASANPDLAITKQHSGSFRRGQAGATYTIMVTNSGTTPTSGTVTVTDSLPEGLQATGITGSGWGCTLSTLTCTRDNPLAAGSSYPPITLTVNVAPDAPLSVINTATVSGGGEVNTANDTDTDKTSIRK